MDRQRMLVVEDDRTTCDLLRAIFTPIGWEVIVASTVAEGLVLLDPPPYMLILDLSLPDGDGIHILRHIRSAQLPTRVVVASGHDPEVLRAVTALKPDALLQKPFEMADLCAACDLNAAEQEAKTE